MKIVIATHNMDKLLELKNALEEFNKKIDFLSLLDFPEIGDIDESGKTLEENALIKASEVNRITGLPSISDDTGLEVDALHGKPGVFTARYAGENCSYLDNVNKLLDDLSTVPIPNRTAKFKTVMAYVDTNIKLTEEGVAEGVITRSAVGEYGFGYDPIFFIPEANKTFAEMDINQKKLFSHRGKAVKNIVISLCANLDNFNQTISKEIA